MAPPSPDGFAKPSHSLNALLVGIINELAACCLDVGCAGGAAGCMCVCVWGGLAFVGTKTFQELSRKEAPN